MELRIPLFFECRIDLTSPPKITTILNYRYGPIALVTAASKIFEICILEVLEMYLITHDHHFRFKSKHSTDMCIFTVKSIVKYYTRQNSPVYTCFLDTSKAFDRINHWTLFRKLIDCQVPLLIVDAAIV